MHVSSENLRVGKSAYICSIYCKILSLKPIAKPRVKRRKLGFFLTEKLTYYVIRETLSRSTKLTGRLLRFTVCHRVCSSN